MGCSSWVLLSTSPPPYTFSLALLSHKVSEVFLLLGFLWFVLLKLCLPAQLLLSLLLYITAHLPVDHLWLVRFHLHCGLGGLLCDSQTWGNKCCGSYGALCPTHILLYLRNLLWPKMYPNGLVLPTWSFFFAAWSIENLFSENYDIVPFKSFQRAGYLKG